MNLWIIGIIIVAIAALIAGIVKLVKKLAERKAKRTAEIAAVKHARDKEEREAREWIEWMDNPCLSDEDFAAIDPPPAGWENFENIPELLERQKRTKNRLAEKEIHRREIETHFMELRNQPDLMKRCFDMSYVNHKLKRDSYEDSQIAQQRLEITAMTVTALLEHARSGDRASFIVLNDFTCERNYGMSTSLHYDFSGTFYEPPDDWNELVVKFYESPGVEDFRNIGFRRNSSQLKLLAAEALRCQSLVNAQIVFAFCSDTNKDLIGAVLSADLAKMVDAIHADRKMFSTKSTETRS